MKQSLLLTTHNSSNKFGIEIIHDVWKKIIVHLQDHYILQCFSRKPHTIVGQDVLKMTKQSLHWYLRWRSWKHRFCKPEKPRCVTPLFPLINYIERWWHWDRHVCCLRRRWLWSTIRPISNVHFFSRFQSRNFNYQRIAGGLVCETVGAVLMKKVGQIFLNAVVRWNVLISIGSIWFVDSGDVIQPLVQCKQIFLK